MPDKHALTFTFRLEDPGPDEPPRQLRFVDSH
jgi:hypothetical protein